MSSQSNFGANEIIRSCDVPLVVRAFMAGHVHGLAVSWITDWNGSQFESGSKSEIYSPVNKLFASTTRL